MITKELNAWKENKRYIKLKHWVLHPSVIVPWGQKEICNEPRWERPSGCWTLRRLNPAWLWSRSSGVLLYLQHLNMLNKMRGSWKTGTNSCVMFQWKSSSPVLWLWWSAPESCFVQSLPCDSSLALGSALPGCTSASWYGGGEPVSSPFSSSENMFLFRSKPKLSISVCLAVAFLLFPRLLNSCTEKIFSAPVSTCETGGNIRSMSLVNSDKVPLLCGLSSPLP